MTDPLRTSNERKLPVVWHGWCDFGRCSWGCWKRCQVPNGRWDGAQTHLWREVWKVLRHIRQKPQQQSLDLEPKEAA